MIGNTFQPRLRDGTDVKLRHEEWRPLVGYEEYYDISNIGRIRSLRISGRQKRRVPRILKLKIDPRSGYWIVNLQRDFVKKGHFVHCLVALTFIGPRPEGKWVNHIDTDRANPRADNLEYITPSENAQYTYDVGNRRADGENNGFAKLTKELVLKAIALVEEGKTQRAIGSELGIHQSTVSDIVTGRCWSEVTGRRKGVVA